MALKRIKMYVASANAVGPKAKVGGSVTLQVVPADPNNAASEDNLFSQQNPNGTLVLAITDPSEFTAYVPGTTFYLDVTPAP